MGTRLERACGADDRLADSAADTTAGTERKKEP
jgi:hypothetical protein